MRPDIWRLDAPRSRRLSKLIGIATIDIVEGRVKQENNIRIWQVLVCRIGPAPALAHHRSLLGIPLDGDAWGGGAQLHRLLTGRAGKSSVAEKCCWGRHCPDLELLARQAGRRCLVAECEGGAAACVCHPAIVGELLLIVANERELVCMYQDMVAANAVNTPSPRGTASSLEQLPWGTRQAWPTQIAGECFHGLPGGIAGSGESWERLGVSAGWLPIGCR